MDSREVAASRPWLAVGQEIADTLRRVDAAAFDRLATAFDNEDRRWFFFGQGRSGLSAQMAAMRFMHLGRKVHCVGEATAPSVRRGDGLLVVSGSGETATSVAFARIAKDEDAHVVALTRAPHSTLAGIADLAFIVPVEQSEQFGGSLFEQSCLVLLDSIVLHLARRTPDAHLLMRRRHMNLQ
jgi:6-phospho-3-hexuloisomerase